MVSKVLKSCIKAKRQLTAPPQGTGFLPLTPPPFNAQAQHVRTDGPFKFVAPGPNDQRGQCLGLNAMANPGYLPHNGIATATQFINATNTVFGMSEDLGRFLAFYGAWVEGDGTSWPVGGGVRTGIGGSHNNYETDSSPVRGDLFQYGNLRAVRIQFQTLYNMQPNARTANYNLGVLRDFRGKRFEESIEENLYFTLFVTSYAAFAATELGSYSSDDVKKSPLCYSLVAGQALQAQFGGLSDANQLGLSTLLGGAISQLQCKQFANGANFTSLNRCPGFQGFYGGTTAPVAPGAIQDP